MKQSWYEEIHDILYRVILSGLPMEIIHFPSTGITSAINRFVDRTKNDPESKIKCIIVDIASAHFTDTPAHNKGEFIRLIKSYIEQSIESDVPISDQSNFYRSLEEVFNYYMQKGQKVLLVIEASVPIDMKLVPEYRDMLCFIDRIRDNTGGRINFVLTTSAPHFGVKNPAPVPIVTYYFSYYQIPWINRSINKDLLGDSPYKRHSVEDVVKLVEISGGLVALVKGLIRDMILRGMKIGEIHDLSFDLNFFNEFPNTKMMIDRMIYQLPKQTADALYSIANNSPIEIIDRDIMCYLHKVGVIDENDRIRSQMLVQYFKLCYEPKAEKIVETSFVEKRDEENTDNDASKYYQVNSKTRLHKLSGQILVGDIPSNEYLTEKELTLFIYMYSRPNQDVTREELARIIWTENTDAQYSDWAIDKVISRIREKLGDKKPYTLIKTARKIGFKIVQ